MRAVHLRMRLSIHVVLVPVPVPARPQCSAKLPRRETPARNPDRAQLLVSWKRAASCDNHTQPLRNAQRFARRRCALQAHALCDSVVSALYCNYSTIALRLLPLRPRMMLT